MKDEQQPDLVSIAKRVSDEVTTWDPSKPMPNTVILAALTEAVQGYVRDDPPCLGHERVYELLAEFGITETDTLKHRLEDHQRWKDDIVEQSSELSEARAEIARLKSVVAEEMKNAQDWFEIAKADGRGREAAEQREQALRDENARLTLERDELRRMYRSAWGAITHG